jgi:(p)ppGpp synthase/HD superfamily hydrolase
METNMLNMEIAFCNINIVDYINAWKKDKILSEIEIAEKIATIGHCGIYRDKGRDKGLPYIIHPTRIASKLSGSVLVASAFLHDIIEDTFITAETLEKCGISPIVIETVQAVTKRKGENYFDFIMRISQHPFARELKIADLNDNMASLEEGSLKDKYRFAHYILTLKTKNEEWYANLKNLN